MSDEQMQDKVVAELMQRIRTSPNDSESGFYSASATSIAMPLKTRWWPSTE